MREQKGRLIRKHKMTTTQQEDYTVAQSIVLLKSSAAVLKNLAGDMLMQANELELANSTCTSKDSVTQMELSLQ